MQIIEFFAIICDITITELSNMKQITQYTFLDVDNVLVYQDNRLNVIYNDTLIRALNAASLTSVILLTDMALRDVPGRERLLTYLSTHGIEVAGVYSKLDFLMEGKVLGSAFELAKGNVDYIEAEGKLIIKDTKLDPLRPENISKVTKTERLKGRDYDTTEKGKIMTKFTEEHSDENIHALFVDDSCHQLASVRDAFEPQNDSLIINNMLFKDTKAENPQFKMLVLPSSKGVLVTHYNLKDIEENTFVDYTRTFLTFLTQGLDGKSQVAFRDDFEKTVRKGGKKLEGNIEALFDKLNGTLKSISSTFSSSTSSNDDDDNDNLRTKSASASSSTSSRFSRIFKRGGRGGDGAGGVSHQQSY